MPVRRGDVYDAELDPTVGSEQAGRRPVVIVSRNAINDNTDRVIGIPCTTYRPGRRMPASRVRLYAPDGGLTVDSLALCDQVRTLAQSRLGRRRGTLSPSAMDEIDRALLIALDLPGQW